MHYQKKFSDITWQPQQYLVSLLRYFKLCFCTQGLENPKEIGKYCSVSNIQKVSVFVLTITPNQQLIACFQESVIFLKMLFRIGLKRL